MKKLLKQFIKFAVIGSFVTFIHIFLMFLLTEFFNFYYVLSSVIGFLCANITSYGLNKKYTFEYKKKSRKNYFVFLFISIIAISFNLIILYVLTEFFYVYYILSQLIATAGSLIVNFIGNRFITFRQ